MTHSKKETIEQNKRFGNNNREMYKIKTYNYFEKCIKDHNNRQNVRINKCGPKKLFEREHIIW